MKNTFISNLEWRFATKKFDPNKEVSKVDLEKILKAIRFTPSSMGLQTYHIIVVQDDKLKQDLYPVAKNQSQVVDCQYLLIFCYRLDLRERIKIYIDVREELEPDIRDQRDKIADRLGKFADRKEEAGLVSWARRQTYIALGFGMAACAELAIDSCPMEGFIPAEADKVLQLPSYIKSTAFLAVGYRQNGPSHPKLRFPESDLFSIR